MGNWGLGWLCRHDCEGGRTASCRKKKIIESLALVLPFKFIDCSYVKVGTGQRGHPLYLLFIRYVARKRGKEVLLAFYCIKEMRNIPVWRTSC